MSKKTVKVPKELTHPFFFPDDMITWDMENETKLNLEVPFIYEVAYFSGHESQKPWNDDPEGNISALLKEWLKVKEIIRIPFDKRDKKATIPLMRKGIGLFLEFLHWSNGQPTKLHPEIEYHLFEIKPVNIKERLEFITARPNLHHSYMQLVELMSELEKGYKKSIVMKKGR